MPHVLITTLESQVNRFKYLVLLGSLLLLVTAPPLIQEWTANRHWFDVLFVLALCASVPAVGRQLARLIALALFIPAVVAFILREFMDVQLLPMPGLVLAATLLIYTAAVILFDIFKTVRVTSDTICGAICVYLLLGVTWALSHQIVAVNFTPTSEISAAYKGLDAGSQFYDFVYFSFVTITSLGYGDITPVSPPARMFSWLEALSGQLFMAILIARFVGLHSRSLRTDK